jgi:hypothetical protein
MKVVMSFYRPILYVGYEKGNSYMSCRQTLNMGIVGVKWRCPSCNVDVGGSMGELKNHIKNVHSNTTTAIQK